MSQPPILSANTGMPVAGHPRSLSTVPRRSLASQDALRIQGLAWR